MPVAFLEPTPPGKKQIYRNKVSVLFRPENNCSNRNLNILSNLDQDPLEFSLSVTVIELLFISLIKAFFFSL